MNTISARECCKVGLSLSGYEHQLEKITSKFSAMIFVTNIFITVNQVYQRQYFQNQPTFIYILFYVPHVTLKLSSSYAPQHHQPMNVLLRTDWLVHFMAGLKIHW
jgi:hypothetical protein